MATKRSTRKVTRKVVRKSSKANARKGVAIIKGDGKTDKHRIYKIYSRRKSVEPKQAESLVKQSKSGVKVATVRCWISAWNHGYGQPTVAVS